jgi:hypothetical protein
MSLSFSCPNCDRKYTVGETLAGKRVKCKGCGADLRIPAAPPRGPESDDIYGLYDEGAPGRGESPGVDHEEPVAAFPRGSGPGPSRAKPKSAARGDGQPWGLELRKGVIFFIFAGLLGIVLLQFGFVIKPRGGKPMDPAAQRMLGGVFLAIGSILAVISYAGAGISYLRGNRRAFEGESTLGQVAWIGSGVVALLMVFVLAFGFAHRDARPPWVARGPAAGLPGGRTGAGPAEPSPGPPPSPFDREPTSDVRVALSNGKLMRQTSPIGTAMPGVEIRVDYRVEGGSLAPGERFILVIQSPKGRGELDHLPEMSTAKEGTIGASSFTASSQEGPYEAWVEVTTGFGPLGRRKTVSETLALQWTDVPVRDLAKEAAEAAKAASPRFPDLAAPPEMPRPPFGRPRGQP